MRGAVGVAHVQGAQIAYRATRGRNQHGHPSRSMSLGLQGPNQSPWSNRHPPSVMSALKVRFMPHHNVTKSAGWPGILVTNAGLHVVNQHGLDA